MKNWFTTILTAFLLSINALAQATPHTVLDYNEADEWHHNDYTGDDYEGNTWQVSIRAYYRSTEHYYRHLNPPWSVMEQIAESGQWGMEYVTYYNGNYNEPFPHFDPFYFEPEHYTRTCMAIDEEGPIMGSIITTTTQFEIFNDIYHEAQWAKNRSTEFTAKVLWQWIPVDSGCGEDGALTTQLGSATYVKDDSTDIAGPNQQAKIVTFIAGRFPSNNP